MVDRVFDVYDMKALRRRGGRPLLGSAPAEVVPVRIDPELKAAIDARAAADETSTSEVIREALRRYLISPYVAGWLLVDVGAFMTSLW